MTRFLTNSLFILSIAIVPLALGCGEESGPIEQTETEAQLEQEADDYDAQMAAEEAAEQKNGT